VQRQDRNGAQIEKQARRRISSIQVYSQGTSFHPRTGLFATLRRTLAQSAAAVMWEFTHDWRCGGVSRAWAIAIVFIVWIAKTDRAPRDDESSECVLACVRPIRKPVGLRHSNRSHIFIRHGGADEI